MNDDYQDVIIENLAELKQHEQIHLENEFKGYDISYPVISEYDNF